MKRYLLLYHVYIMIASCSAWIAGHVTYHTVRGSRHTTIEMGLSTGNGEETFDIAMLDGDETSIRQAAKFMVQAYWLSNILVQKGIGPISDRTQAILVEEQALDFTIKFGERMGRRIVDSCLLRATDTATGEPLGLVGVETCLLDGNRQDIIPVELSEDILKDAVSRLGPKQRRQYKDASAITLASELLPPEQLAVCCLSNLAVSPKARRKGVAIKLCECVENIARESGFDSVHLKVESANEAACRLYKDRLGYRQVSVIEDASAMRIDLDAGKFVQIKAKTELLAKSLT